MKTGFPRQFLYAFLITAVVLLLAVFNHTPNTWLLGWDSLSDEFNFKINAQRQFFGVWNEYQGLGTAGGHAHEADIPRFLYLLLASLILPTSVLRYSYFFFTLLIGSLGMFQFAKYIFKTQSYKTHLAFMATSFYIFNLGTLQIFYVPFEMFNAQFMVLPWIFLFVLKFIRHSHLKDYAWLCLFIFLGTPQAYAPVLFFALLGSVIGFLGIYFLLNTNKLQTFIRSLYVGGAFAALNLYWIVPNLYFIKNYSESVTQSKINSLFSEEAFLYSTKWGTWLDFPLLRGFLFGWLDYKHATGENYYLMDFWRNYMANPIVLSVGLFFFAIVIFGIIAAILRRKLTLISFLPIFALWLFMIIGANGIIAPLWHFLRDNIELFREGLRFPFSKFSILLQFGYSIFFVYGVIAVLEFLRRSQKLSTSGFKKVFLTVFAIVPIIYMSPFFTGNLISKEMQIKLPSDYIGLFNKFAEENPNKRIVYLPANSLFGWNYYDWGGQGYQGAGFVWFGLAQSFVTRDFDRWHPANEQFYNELQYAIYNENSDLLEYLLKKYDVSYIVLDKSLIAPNNRKSLFYEETGELLKRTPHLQLSNTIGNIDIYTFRDPTLSQDYVEFPKTVSLSRQINYEEGFPYYDTNFADKVSSYSDSNVFDANKISEVLKTREIEITLPIGSEISSNKVYAVSVPFASRHESIPVEFTFQNSELSMEYIYPEIVNKMGEVVFTNVPIDLFPSIPTGTSQVLVNNKLLQGENLQYKSLIDEDSELITFSPQNSGVFEYSNNIYSATATDCSGVEGDVAKIYNDIPGSVGIETIDGVTGCLNFEDRISNSQPVMYKISFEYQNSDTAVPMYCLSDTTEGECFNQQYQNRPESSVEGFTKYEDYVLINNPEIVRFVLVLASADHNTPVSAVFRNINIERFEVFTVQKLLNPALRGLEKNMSLKASDFPLTIKFPDYGELSSSYSAGSGRFNTKARSCDELSQKSYKRELKTEDGRNFYEYYAEDAISCDTLEASVINTKASYLVNFDSETQSGQGLDICLWGINLEKCLLQERLNGGLETYLLPSYSSAGGVSISINNSSIGRIPTTNRLYGVDVHYMPYAWLKEVIIRDKSADLSTSIGNVSVFKKSIYEYDLKLKPDDLGKQLNLSLNQSFDSGWVLLNKESCLMGIISPWTCKMPNSSHLVYNGWANGWNFTVDAQNYRIIFWPQLLQLGGYLIFMLFIGVLGVLQGVRYFYKRPHYKA